MAKLNEIINLNEEQKQIIINNLNDKGRLPCIKAFKVAKLIKLLPIQMSDACKSIDVKITSCELGVFGKIDFLEKEDEIYKEISKNFKDNTDVECKTLWQLAKNSSLRRVGSTVKNSDVEVTYCQLGCFNERKGHR